MAGFKSEICFLQKMFGGGMVHQSISSIEKVGFFKGIYSSAAPSMMEIDSLHGGVFCSLQMGLPSGPFGFAVGGCTKFSRTFHFWFAVPWKL